MSSGWTARARSPGRGFGHILDLGELARDPTLVAPGNPDASRLYLVMLRRLMPKDVASGVDDKTWPDAEQLTRVREWIQGLPAVDEPAACAGRRRARAAEAEVLVREIAAAGYAAGRQRFVTLAHLHDACIPARDLDAFREALEGLVREVRGNGDVRLQAVDATRTLFRLDLADIGWTTEDWERLVARTGALPSWWSPAHAAALAEKAGSAIPLVRGDWLAHALAREPSGESQGGADVQASQAESASPSSRVGGLTVALALARQFTRPVHLSRAAAELGVDTAAIIRLADAGDGLVGATARRLAQGLVARPEADGSLRLLAAALAQGGPTPVGNTIEAGLPTTGQSTASAASPGADLPQPIDAGPAVLLVADKATYRVDDRLRLFVRANVDCHPTVIGIDKRGRATVLYPSDLEPGDLLKAGRTLELPGKSAGYAFRLKEVGRERIVALCNPVGPLTDGIFHDFERQRFTDLGDWTTYLAQQQEAEAERRRREAQPSTVPQPRPRIARWRPPEPTRARAEEVGRTAIAIDVRP
jgi:hypothetical protein